MKEDFFKFYIPPPTCYKLSLQDEILDSTKIFNEILNFSAKLD